MPKSQEPRELTPEDVTELYDMLTYARPHKDEYEERFIKRFISPLGMKRDDFGNLYKRIGDNSPIAWSCHTDTVHRKGGMQHIHVDDKYIARLATNSHSTCLGADDTAGVWLMVQMIKAGAPGLYMFHRGEEIGCQGSKWTAKNAPGVLKNTKFVVALDRRDHDSIITFQCSNRCCSEDFAKSMGMQLGDLKYKADDTGLFTDSASYVDLVGECTNISVGYKGQHGKTETLDVVHLANLYKSLIRLDASKLVSKRKPGDKESKYASYYSGGWQGGHYRGNDYNSQEWRENWHLEQFRGWVVEGGALVKANLAEWEKWRTRKLLAKNKKNVVPVSVANGNVDPDLLKVIEVVKSNPDQAAELFFSWGLDAAMLREAMLENMFHQKNVLDDPEGDVYGVH